MELFSNQLEKYNYLIKASRNKKIRNLVCNALTILTRKNFSLTEFSTKIHRNTRSGASDVFHMFTNQLSSFNSIILQMSEKRDSSNRQ